MAKGNTVDTACVTTQGRHRLATGGIPDPSCLVTACRCHILAVWAKNGSLHVISVVQCMDQCQSAVLKAPNIGRIVITGRYQPTASLCFKGEVIDPSVVCGCRPDSHRTIGAGCRHSDTARIVSDIVNRTVMTLQPLDFGYPCIRIRHIPDDGCACEVNGHKTQTVGAKNEVQDRFGMAIAFDRRAF